MANSRIKDLSERTTLASGDYLATDNNNGTRKVDASKILTPISDAQTTADNVATKVSNSGDAFSSSKGYSVGELCIYNNKVYRCKTAYSTGASWSSRSSYFDQVTLTDAVSDLNNALSELTEKEYFTLNKISNAQIQFTGYGIYQKSTNTVRIYLSALGSVTSNLVAQGIPAKYRPSTSKSVPVIASGTAGLGYIKTDGTIEQQITGTYNSVFAVGEYDL